MNNRDIEQKAINLVKGEWRAYEDAEVFVTDKIKFKLRNLVKTLRKNYWGIFDDDKDPVTGQKLTWVGLTEWICDTWVKNTDVDSKDVNVKAKTRKGVGLATIIRYKLTNWMDHYVFGETLDETERQMAIDGSHIWKTFKGYDKQGKLTVIREDVDLLNAYFDPTCKSIQDAYRFTERGLLTKNEMKQMTGWDNVDKVKGTSGLHPTDTDLTSVSDTSKVIDVWETWGLIPLSLITGNDKDEEEVEGHIVVSGLQGGGQNALVHLIETNPDGLKPYEEAHTKKILGRWLARGPAESVMFLQSWLNMIVNIRKVKHMVSQLGIFKLKKGSGVSPQNISRMAAMGVLSVNNMDDIEQFVMQEASQSSYKDEDIAVNWSQRITSAYDSVTGETMPASSTATNTVVQQKAANSSFVMFRKQIGFFLERWLKRHVIPVLSEMITVGEILRMTGEVTEIEDFDKLMVYYLVSDKLDKDFKKGKYYDVESVKLEIERTILRLKKQGLDRYIEIVKKIDLTEYDVLIYIGDEKFDPGSTIKSLIEVLKVAPQYQNSIIKQVADIMGIDVRQLEQQEVALPVQQASSGQAVNIPNQQQQFTNANVR